MIEKIGVLTEYLIYWFVGRGCQLFAKFELYQLTVMHFLSRKIAIPAMYPYLLSFILCSLLGEADVVV